MGFDAVKGDLMNIASKEIAVSKPFSNEHSARQTDPSKYDKFRRGTLASGVSAIYGIKNGKSEVQSVRFDAKKFTVEQAKAWLKKNNFSVRQFEAASKTTKESIKKCFEDENFQCAQTDKNFWKGVL
jgi:hypothetical protein